MKPYQPYRREGPRSWSEPRDPTSLLGPPDMIPCFACGQKMPGNLGLQVSHKVPGSAVLLHVIVHVHCASEV